MRLDAIPAADTRTLELRFVELAEKLRDVKTERQAIAAELLKREQAARAAARVAAMSDSDKQALRRALR
jgi:hypothetical protein